MRILDAIVITTKVIPKTQRMSQLRDGRNVSMIIVLTIVIPRLTTLPIIAETSIRNLENDLSSFVFMRGLLLS